MNNINISKRYHLLDILRLMSMLAIICFHCGEFIFYNDSIPFRNPSLIYTVIYSYARTIPFSGQSIIFLSFFLLGLKQRILEFKVYYLVIFLLGHIVINYSFSESFADLLNWDIYPFLMVSFLLLIKVSKSKRRIHFILFYLSVIILIIPTNYFYFPIESHLLADIIYGACNRGLSGAWPLLPWIALPTLSYCLGRILAPSKLKISLMTKFEFLIWSVILISSISSIYFIYPWSLFDVPIGANFYCFILNLHPANFWSYFLPFLFLVRISFLSKLNNSLSHNKISIFISSLKWNTHFALTYVCQIVILFFISYYEDYYTKYSILFDIALLSVLPLSEVLSRFSLIVAKKVST